MRFQFIGKVGLQQVFVQRGLFPEGAQLLLCAGLRRLGLLRQLPQLLVFLRELGENLPQIDGRSGGLHGIPDKQRGNDHGQRVDQQIRQLVKQAINGRMNKPHQQDGEKAPGNRTGEADIAVEVAGLFGIVPVADLEQLLHHSPHHIFQQRSGQHTENVNQPQIVRHRQSHEEDDDGAGAVDRQQGAVEKAAVHPLALLSGDIAGFPDPAAEAVEEKQQGPLTRSIYVHLTILSGARESPPRPAAYRLLSKFNPV